MHRELLQGLSLVGTKVETEVSTFELLLWLGLEVDLQSELSEAAFVVGPACNTALLCGDGKWSGRDGSSSGLWVVIDIVIGCQDVKVVVVQYIESFCAEFKIDLLVDWEELANR